MSAATATPPTTATTVAPPTQDELVTIQRRLDMAGLRVGLVMNAIGHDPRYTVQLKDLHDVMGDLTAILCTLPRLLTPPLRPHQQEGA